MNRSSEAKRVRADWVIRQRMRSRWLILPSWLSSSVVHLLVFYLLAVGLKSCQPVRGGGNESNDRVVGLFIKDASEHADEQQQPTEQPSTTPTESTATTRPTEALTNTTDSMPPVETSLPDISLPIIGPGNRSVVPTPSASGMPTQASRSVGSLPSARAPGSGETSFFNVNAKGNRFVYVLDCSGSMSSDNAIRVARNELLASLQQLDATQQFQVIFYNTRPLPMIVDGNAQKMIYASDINRTLARQFIMSVQPDGGTQHLPALTMALQLNPDVIFFLTDAGSQLAAGELRDIERLNRKTVIHCIEFGKGSEISVDNFLKKLARQHHGSYRYMDVTKFNRRNGA